VRVPVLIAAAIVLGVAVWLVMRFVIGPLDAQPGW
jgi:hypothetical protein